MIEPLFRMRVALRQRGHHRAFRIAAPAWDDAQQTRLQQVIVDLAAVGPAAPVTDGALDEAALAEAATNLWRARKKLDQGGERPSKEARQAGRYLRSSHQALAEAGLVIQDHDGTEFHPGYSLEALVIEDDPALRTETVLETVRPSVYFRDRRIQMGQVIVGRPPLRAPTGEENHA